MEQRFSLHGPTRSMSSLASTILHVPSSTTSQAPPRFSPHGSDSNGDTPVELTIPLPPSRTGSEEEIQDVETIPPAMGVEQPLPESMDHVPAEEIPSPGTVGVLDPSLKSAATAVTPPVSLEQLKSLVALENDHICRANDLRQRLNHLHHLCGLDRRLLRISASLYRSMVGHFHTADRVGFLEAYDAAQEMLDANQPSNTATGDVDTVLAPGPPNWIEVLPLVHRDNFLHFLAKLRSEPSYLADCLSSLPSTELVALTSNYRSTNVPVSIFPGRPNVKAQRFSKDPGVASRSRWSLDYGQEDPFFVLFYAIFDDSQGPGTWEYCQRIEVWANACSRIMVDGKRGSDEVVTTTLDAFANLQEWSLKPRLESYLANLLRRGAFLLEITTNQVMDFEEPLEIRNAKAAISASEFFEKSIRDLFTLLADHLPSTIPPGLRDLVHSVLGKIEDTKVRNRAEIFMLSKWFFCSFISNMLIYPESHGMLMTHHIGNTARTTVLKELAARMHKQVFDVSSPWKHSLVSSQSQALIENIFAIFKPPQGATRDSEGQPQVRQSQKFHATASLLLSPRDALSLITTLHPRLPSPAASLDGLYSERASTASSVAESSTLTSGSTGYDSGVPSFIAPSTRGTSMTSTTMLSEAPLQELVGDSPADVNLKPCSTAQRAREIPREPKGDHVTSLIETSQVIHSMVETDPSFGTALHHRNWASLNVSESGNLLRADFRDCLDEVQDIEPKQGERGYSEGIDSETYRDFENAICRSMDYQNNWLDLQYLTNAIGMGRDYGSDCPGALDLLFRSAMSFCQSNLNFHEAHMWWKSLQTLQEITARGNTGEALNAILAHVIRRKQSVISVNAQISKQYEGHLLSLERLAKQQNVALATAETQRKALRLKMWYVCDAKHSATYEDALGVTRALKAMTDGKRSKRFSSVTSWARQRLRTPLSHDKSAAHVLEALAAPKDCGGPSKLADQQVEHVGRWLTKNSIENFCKGEERIHRFCQEVQKCANKLVGANLLESPVLWSSNLFTHEKASLGIDHGSATSFHFGEVHKEARHSHWSGVVPQAPPSPVSPTNPPAPFNLNLHPPKTMNSFWKTPASNIYQPRYVHALRNGTAATDTAPWATPRSHGPFSGSSWPAQQSSGYRVKGSHSLGTVDSIEARQFFVDHVKNVVTSLLLSDLGYLSWSQGSETDDWTNRFSLDPDLPNSKSPPALQLQAGTQMLESSPACGDALSDTTITTSQRQEVEGSTFGRGEHPKYKKPENIVHGLVHGVSKSRPSDEICSTESFFPFSDAYANILERLSSTYDPYAKLDLLCELETLTASSLQDVHQLQVLARARSSSAISRKTSPPMNTIGTRSVNVPRTKATSLEEIIANCTERRAGTLQFASAFAPPQPAPSLSAVFQPPEHHLTGTDELVDALLSIFRNNTLRPPTLYRDLQMIAAHIPSSILDQTAKGKAFWDAGLAALALKEERISAIIDRATRITTYHISATKNDPQTFTFTYAPDLVNTTLADAAQLWTIAAKEGSPVAARELALFYLTHPELLPRVTMPLSKAKDVFRTVGSNERGVDTGGLDPSTFAVVFHWMEVAANGGDKDAKDFLRGTGDLSGGR